MISLNQISMSYGDKLLFFDVSMILNSNNAYALVGANGCGKSTFFRLLTGEEELTSGDISVPNDVSVGWLKQDQFKYQDTPIREVVLQGKPRLWEALCAREKLLQIAEWDDAMGYRYAELEEIIGHYDGYNADAQAENILSGLGIDTKYFDQPLKSLSGGYKLRVLLAQTLFQNPDILLLDEPTNHLDILSIRWLEKFLQNEFRGLLVFISHDIDFINNLADYILDLDYGDICQYPGKWKKFLEEKQLLADQRMQEVKSAESKIAEMQKFVDRFKAKASKAAQARSRMKMIEKIEIPDVKRSSRIAPNFQFVQKRLSGKQVLQVENLAMSFGEKKLFANVNFTITRGERIAIMGVNGIGKSTMIKIIIGSLVPSNGAITFGHEVKCSYFSQDHHELLNSSMTVWQWLSDNTSGANEQDMRKALGRMLFVKDDVDKDILSLSGGEAARLLFAKIMLEHANFIILDEPTNHMDLETIEALGSALADFSGTVLFVSHNRHFIDSIATRILYFAPDRKMIDHRGNYAAFADKYME